MGYKAMDLLPGIHLSKRHSKLIKNLNLLDSNVLFLVIRLPSSGVLKLLIRALFLALVIVSFPWLNNTFISNAPSISNPAKNSQPDLVFLDPISTEILPLLFRDLANEGLLKTGDRALLMPGGDQDYQDSVFKTRIVTDFNMDMIDFSDSEQQNVIPDDTYDFVFVHDFRAASGLIERTLKTDGIVTLQLGDSPGFSFQKPSDYKTVYLRRFDSTAIIAMKKLAKDSSSSSSSNSSPTRRRLFGLTTDVKKKALNNLEDVLLEPPRAASGKSSTYRKKTRYLPDLINDSLERYHRRVFIDVGLPDKNEASGDSSWFSKNYPTRNTEFEMYKIETVTEEPSKKEVAQIGMSDWLRKNVKENEYVVMKAEAEVVEDLVRSKAIELVDELFLECKHRGMKKSGIRPRRAYWECLALYGRLRDEGVAVHQWWG